MSRFSLLKKHDHAGGAALEDSVVVAEPEGTGGRPGSQTETELTARHSADLRESSGDGHRHPGPLQDHPGADRGTEFGLHPGDAGLTEDRGERGEDE